MKITEDDNKNVKLRKLKKKKQKRNKNILTFEEEEPSDNKKIKNLFKKHFEETPFMAYPYINSEGKQNSQLKKTDIVEEKKEMNVNPRESKISELNSEVFSSCVPPFCEEDFHEKEKMSISGNIMANNTYSQSVLSHNFNQALKNEKSQDLAEFIDHLDRHSNNNTNIWDDNFNVDIKFLINEDGKLHEIQFKYNLLNDKKADVIEEIKSEFNFSKEHLKNIYEILKKLCKYKLII